MNRRLPPYVSGSALLAGLLLGAVWTYQATQPPGEAWMPDRSEQVLCDVSIGQELNVAFRLKNTSRRRLRILGAEAC